MNLTKKERQSIIGSSEVGAILGYHKHKSPYDVWLEKTRGVYKELPESVTIAGWHGHCMESHLIDKYEERTDKKVLRDVRRFTHHTHKWMISHPDGMIVGMDGLLEVKTASAYKSAEWDIDEYSDLIPMEYLCQVQHQMLLTKTKWCDVIVLVGSTAIKIYHIDRNNDFIEAMTHHLCKFWENNVIKDVAPDCTTMDDVRSRWGEVRHDIRLATDDEIVLVDRVKKIRFENKRLKKEEKDIKFKLANTIGNHEGLKLIDESLLVMRKKTKTGRSFNFFDRGKV